MSLNFNGTNVDKVIYNGVELDKVIYNGVVVYEAVSYDYTRSYFFIQNPTANSLTFKIRFNAFEASSSNPLYVYYYYIGEGRERPNDPSSTITSSGKKTLTFSLDGNGTAVIEFAGSRYDYYNTSSTLFYQNHDLLTKAVLGSNCYGEYYLFGAEEELTEIIFAAPISFDISNCPKLSVLTFKEPPKYVGYISDTLLTSITLPANITSLNGVTDNPNLETLTIYAPDLLINYRKFENNPSLKHLYVYSTKKSTSGATSAVNSWVYGCHPDLTIHLSASIGTITNAKTLFGYFFNYIDSSRQATVLFDL